MTFYGGFRKPLTGGVIGDQKLFPQLHMQPEPGPAPAYGPRPVPPETHDISSFGAPVFTEANTETLDRTPAFITPPEELPGGLTLDRPPAFPDKTPPPMLRSRIGGTDPVPRPQVNSLGLFQQPQPVGMDSENSPLNQLPPMSSEVADRLEMLWGKMGAPYLNQSNRAFSRGADNRMINPLYKPPNKVS